MRPIDLHVFLIFERNITIGSLGVTPCKKNYEEPSTSHYSPKVTREGEFIIGESNRQRRE